MRDRFVGGAFQAIDGSDGVYCARGVRVTQRGSDVGERERLQYTLCTPSSHYSSTDFSCASARGTAVRGAALSAGRLQIRLRMAGTRLLAVVAAHSPRWRRCVGGRRERLPVSHEGSPHLRAREGGRSPAPPRQAHPVRATRFIRMHAALPCLSTHERNWAEPTTPTIPVSMADPTCRPHPACVHYRPLDQASPSGISSVREMQPCCIAFRAPACGASLLQQGQPP